MRNIPGLRLRTDGRWENDFNEQSVLDYRERSLDRGLPSICKYEVKTLHSFTSGSKLPPDIRLLRSRNRSTLPIAPYGIRPTTSYGFMPNWLPIVYSGYVSEDWGQLSQIRCEYEDWVFLVPPVTNLLDIDFSDKLAGRILSKFRVMDSEIGIIIAELGETLKMLHTAVNRVRAGLSLFKRGRFTDIKKTYSDLTGKPWETPKFGNLWLEFRYGWTPFFHDIQSLIKDYNNLNKKLVKLARVSAGHGEPVTNTHKINLAPAGYYLSADVTVTQEVRQRFGYFVLECPGYAQFVGDKFEQITSADVLVERIFNPASTGWDLVPYSFVVDWFFNLGEYLRQTGSLYHNYQIIDGYDRRDSRITEVLFSSDNPTFSAEGSLTHNVGSYLRQKTLRFPHYQPDLDLSFGSVKHLVDSIFLSTQRLKR